jgi:hypothetical protein
MIVIIVAGIIALSVFSFMRKKQIDRNNDRKERLEEKIKELGESLKNNLKDK